MYFIRSTVIIVVLSFTFGINQGKPISSSSNTTTEHVKYLLNLIGVENEYMRFLSYLKIHPPKDMHMRALYNELFSFDSYIGDLTQTYIKYYTLDDITKLIDFYSSPLGRKTLQVNQEINKQVEDLMMNKISDYILTSSEHGFDILLP